MISIGFEKAISLDDKYNQTAIPQTHPPMTPEIIPVIHKSYKLNRAVKLGSQEMIQLNPNFYINE